MRKITITLLLLLSFNSSANLLVVVQAISKSEKSFVTRQGRRDGVYPGTKGTFTGSNVSIIAKATTVTGEYTQWTVDNDFANVPFEKDEIVTFHNTSEYIWTLMPDEIRSKYLKEIEDTYRASLSLRTSLFKGIKQSTSGVDFQETDRGGLVAELVYEKELNRNITYGIGGRFETETINVENSSLTASRMIGIVEGTYYLNELEKFYNGRPYIGLTLGYGQVTFTSSGATQSGPVFILPGVRVGIQLPIDRTYSFKFESAIETISSEQGGEGSDVQTTDSVNARYGIGLRRFF